MQIDRVMVFRIGTLATRNCQPRQAWKGAAAAVDSGAGMRLVRSATQLFQVPFIQVPVIQAPVIQVPVILVSVFPVFTLSRLQFRHSSE